MTITDVEFLKRLNACVEHGLMSTSDAGYWFDVPYPTMWSWLHDTRASGSRGMYADRFETLLPRLIKLEKFIKKNSGFRIPFNLSRKNAMRADYIRALRDGQSLAGFSQPHSANSRREGRV
jgi:hypothetical protein